MRRNLVGLALLIPLIAMATDVDVNKLSGSIRIEAGQHAGNLSTLSGDIVVADHAVVGNVRTVSGSVVFEREVHANGVATVSGSVQLGKGAIATGDVGTVSGSIQLAPGAQVKGHLATVSKSITLDEAQAVGGIETVSGDITIGAGSRVEGGILVDQPEHGDVNFGNDHVPSIVIGPHAVVEGVLDFRRMVILEVSTSAHIGMVRGATVKKFSGATP